MDYERESDAPDSEAAEEHINGAAGTEWPAEDLARHDDATDDEGGVAAAAETAAADDATPAADDELDASDDSDAPIQLDDGEGAGAGGREHIRAENVTLSQGGAGTIEASNVSISQGGVGQVHAEQLNVSQGGVGLARTDELTIQSEGSAFAVLADEATVEPGANVFLLVARSFNNEVRPTVDWRSALAFGAGFALAMSILRRIR